MIVIDYKDKRPIYEQLVSRIEELTAAGYYRAGSQLPSVRQLACELSINPNTIQRAYAELERRGVTCSVRGRGSFITDDIEALLASKKRVLSEEFANMADRMLQHGFSGEELCGIVMACSEGGKNDDRGA